MSIPIMKPTPRVCTKIPLGADHAPGSSVCPPILPCGTLDISIPEPDAADQCRPVLNTVNIAMPRAFAMTAGGIRCSTLCCFLWPEGSGTFWDVGTPPSTVKTRRMRAALSSSLSVVVGQKLSIPHFPTSLLEGSPMIFPVTAQPLSQIFLPVDFFAGGCCWS